jgi:hypothetical protein
MGRRRTLKIDSLEPRELLSITPLINSPGWVQTTAAGTGGASPLSQAATTTSASQLVFDPTTGLYFNPDLGGSGVTTDVAPPRANELTRRNFTATFSGKVLELPPRLIDQSHQFYILAPGTSSAFLHGTAQLRLYTPNPDSITFPDPTNPGTTITETAVATTGTLSMSDRSTQSGSVILANLTGSPTDVDKLGRPTQFNLALNGGGGSGGIYASAVGTGTVDITYHGNRATVKVHASIFVSGIGNPYDIFQGITL